MSVPYALLGLLEQQPRHGYDLKRLVDRYFAPDRPVAFAQVYSTLGRLEQRGRVRIDSIEQAEGPERRRYAITSEGTRELERWLSERHAHLERMRELTAVRRTSPVPIALLADYALFHLEADLRWLDLTAARVDE